VTAAQNTGDGGIDTLSSIENLIGGSGSDTLVGTAGTNVIRGGGGNDVIDGRSGTDTASYRGDGAVTVDLRISGQQNTVGTGLDTLISIENLIGSEFNDTLIGNSGANVLEGGANHDVIDGQGGRIRRATPGRPSSSGSALPFRGRRTPPGPARTR
jgi:Ca2+-binding RTX toxin-like protein